MMNYKEVSRRIGNEAPEFKTGAKVVDDLVNSLQNQGLLPKKLPDAQPEKVSISLLNQAIGEYKNSSHTPELVTQIWQILWQAVGERIELKLTTQPVDRSALEIEDVEANGNGMILVPAEVATQQTRDLLGQAYPKMASYSTKKDNPITNEGKQEGWFDIETTIDAPNLNTRENDLKKLFKSQGREGQNLTQYIVGSQFSKLTIGYYFDENTASRLLGSRHEGRVVFAYFPRGGRLSVDWDLQPDDRRPDIGGRSSGVK